MPVLQLRDLNFGWPSTPQELLLGGVTMGISAGSRIALIGANGQGKSTLMGLMRGVLTPDTVEVIFGHGVTAAHYSQHSADSLPPALSPLEYLLCQIILCIYICHSVITRFLILSGFEPYDSQSWRH